MTAESDNPSSGSEERFASIVEAFEEQVRKGAVPSIAEWAKTYPDFSADIYELFPGLLLMEHTSRHLEQSDSYENNPETIGPYRIIRKLGQGGMGVVYLAEDPSLNRLVAVKILATHRVHQGTSVERFLREAQAVGQLYHPHIVPIFSTGTTETAPFYAMQFIRGCALDELLMATLFAPRGGSTSSAHDSSSMQQIVSRLAKDADESDSDLPAVKPTNHLSWRDATRITREVGSALAHAHAQGILHRDIKPANILVDSDGHAWVADFGLCRLEGDLSMTGTGETVGTLKYMAPEQLEGEAEECSDVYALGLVLYEMVTGSPAMTDTRKAKLIRAIASKEPVRPRRLVPQISKDLETIICKAISKRPADRYASAGHFVRDLERLEAGRAIEARRPSALYHLGLFTRRHKALSAVTVGGLLLISMIVATYTWQLRTKERNRAHGEYSARLGAAEAALQTGATARALQQLALAEAGLRGWEWEHLSAKVDQSLQGIDTGAFARDLQISPDGSQILTTTALGAFQLRLNGSSFELVTVYPGNSYACAWHPNEEEGYYLLEDGTLGSTSGAIFGPENRPIRLSPFASTLTVTERGHVLSGSKLGRVDWVDLSTGLASTLSQRASPVVGMERLQNDTVWVCDQSGWQALWSGEGRLETLPPLASAPIVSASQSLDGNALVVLPRKGAPLWMPKEGLQPVHHLQDPPAHMNRVQFSPDGRWLAGSSMDGFVHLWDVQGGQRAPSLTGHRSRVMSLAWHPDGKLFATGDELGNLRIWHPTVRSGGFTVGHHVFDVLHISFSPDGRTGLSASRDGTFGVWDLYGGLEHKRAWSPPTGVVRAHFLGQGKTAAIMLDTGVLQLWDIERMKEVLALPRIDQPDRMHLDFAVHSKRQTIFSFGLRRSAPGIAVPAIEEWSLDPLEFRRAYAAGPQTLARIAIDESRGWLLATTMDGHLEVLDLEREHSVAHIQVSPDLRPIGGLAYCEAKGWALCTDNSDGAILVDVVRGNVLRTLKREGDTVQSAAFLQGGNRVALGGRRGTIGIWDPISGDHLIDVESLDGWAAALSASPDGTALLVGTSSGTLRYIDCLSAAQRIEQRGRHANNKLASGDQSFEEAGQVAWAQIWWDPEVRLTSASLLIARMRENHPNPGFVAALWSSLAFLRGDSEAAMQHADAALAHDDLSVETRSFLRGMRGLILLRQGEMAPALQELQHVRWREFARILGRERSLRP